MSINSKIKTQKSKIIQKSWQNSKINIDNDELKQDHKEILSRLHRIIGQLQGVEQMLVEGRECSLVIHQLLAARAGLAKIGVKILTKQSCQLETRTNSEKFENYLNQLLNLK